MRSAIGLEEGSGHVRKSSSLSRRRATRTARLVRSTSLTRCYLTIFLIVRPPDCGSIHIKVCQSIILLSHLLVLPRQKNPHDPGADHNTGGETNTSRHSHRKAWCIGIRPEIRGVHRSQVSQRIGKRNGNRLLLIRLAQGGRNPTRNGQL